MIGISKIIAGQHMGENGKLDKLNFWIIGTSVFELGLTSEIEIPSWVKNNAGWWATGQIGDSDFVSGIQYLISNGIMNV